MVEKNSYFFSILKTTANLGGKKWLNKRVIFFFHFGGMKKPFELREHFFLPLASKKNMIIFSTTVDI